MFAKLKSAGIMFWQVKLWQIGHDLPKVCTASVLYYVCSILLLQGLIAEKATLLNFDDASDISNIQHLSIRKDLSVERGS